MTPANLFIKSFKTDEKGEIEKIEVYQENNRHPRKLIIKGVVPDLETKDITENGTYTPGVNFDGFSAVTVDVQPELEEKNIVANGTYTPGLDFAGFSKINVDVRFENTSKLYCWYSYSEASGNTATIYTDSLDINAKTYLVMVNEEDTAYVLLNNEQIKHLFDAILRIVSISEDSLTVEYDFGDEELNNVQVFQRWDKYDIPIESSGEGLALQEKTVTTNGVVSPDNGFDGFSRVTVEVPQRDGLQEKTVTENGTIYPDEGFAGFSKITVNVSNKLYCWHVDTSHINLFVYTNSFDTSTKVYVPIDGGGLQNQEQLEMIGIKVTIESISEDELVIRLSYIGNEDDYEEYTLSRLPENDIEL